MRQPRWRETDPPREPARLLIACIATAVIHLAFYIFMQNYAPKPTEIKLPIVNVEIVARASLSPPNSPPEEASQVIKPTPEPQPKRLPEPVPVPVPEPEPIAEPTPSPPAPAFQPDILPPEGQSSMPVQAAPTPKGEILIPDRWRLPVGARIPPWIKLGLRKALWGRLWIA